MAHTSFFTPSSSLKFNSPLISSAPTSSHSHALSFPSHSFLSGKLRKSVAKRKTIQKSLVKAVYDDEFWTPERSSRWGTWSIRNDLQVPSSPYFPAYAQGQGPPPMVQERFQSVISQLFQYRIIRCGGAVDDDMANIIVAQLLYLDAVDPNKDIIMYVNSPGGSVTAGMAIFDTMRHIRPDVSTVCVGLAASLDYRTHLGYQPAPDATIIQMSSIGLTTLTSIGTLRRDTRGRHRLATQGPVVEEQEHGAEQPPQGAEHHQHIEDIDVQMDTDVQPSSQLHPRHQSPPTQTAAGPSAPPPEPATQDSLDRIDWLELQMQERFDELEHQIQERLDRFERQHEEHYMDFNQQLSAILSFMERLQTHPPPPQ